MGAATAAAKPRAPARPVSARARALQRELGVPFGAAVTFATHHVRVVVCEGLGLRCLAQMSSHAENSPGFNSSVYRCCSTTRSTPTPAGTPGRRRWRCCGSSSSLPTCFCSMR